MDCGSSSRNGGSSSRLAVSGRLVKSFEEDEDEDAQDVAQEDELYTVPVLYRNR